MRKNKQPQPLLNIGTSLLLVLFLVLCLVTFAALSLSSARSDYSFSERLANRKTDYYTASNTAEEILSDLDSVIENAYTAAAAGTGASYQNALSSAVTDFFEDNGEAYGNDILYSVDTESEQPVISYEIPINDSQHLCVTLTTTGDSYEITQWQVVNESTERESESLNLLPITGE